MMPERNERTPPRIALLTDFGTSDPYVASMKGVIAARTAAPVFDLVHDIAPQDVFGAAWFLRTTERWWPGGTIFVGVVDPGVGTGRRILVLTREEKVFLAPDNGLLTFVADGAVARSVEDESSFLPNGSSTFHGRDRFAPLAAAIANGAPVGKLGPLVNDIVRLDYEPGMIVAVDRFGNAITDLEPLTDRFALKAGGHTIDRLCRTYDEGGDGPFLIVGSSGCLEIAVRGGSAASVLQLRRGDRVELHGL
jgi:S-adenosylmethionine hydrolase